ncbi:hypothetical protein N7337_07880 [Comamonas aquatica]|uniref:hypothetical protein n=1 Tax=Comamonas aquatica TaxID=225991 RepID=UPI00244D0D54|nr:hypothetical protein [Comamonas aquatica]MDH0200826.1 hypothetical protein [Comamonas aquatica]
MQANQIDTPIDHWQEHGSVRCGFRQQCDVYIYSRYSQKDPEGKAGVKVYGGNVGFVGLEMALTPDAAIAFADALKAAAAAASEVQAAVDAVHAVGAQQGGAA